MSLAASYQPVSYTVSVLFFIRTCASQITGEIAAPASDFDSGNLKLSNLYFKMKIVTPLISAL